MRINGEELTRLAVRLCRVLVVGAVALVTCGSGGCPGGGGGDGRVCTPDSPRGDAASGDSCVGDCDCLDGLFCGCDGSDDCISTEQRCMEQLGQSERCERSTMCAEGLVCNRLTSTCELPADAGSPCWWNSDCKEELTCWEFEARCARCEPRHEVGEPCEYDSDCVEGLECDTNDARCEAPDQPRPAPRQGEACSGFGTCVEGLECNKAFDPPQCQPPGDVGTPCRTSHDCRESLVCNYELEQCAEVGAEGDPCGWHSDCGDPLECVFVDGTPQCGPADQPQRVCRPWHCPGDTFCAPGPLTVCRPISDLGEPCRRDSNCTGELLCADHVCVTPAEESEPCTLDDECVGDLICNQFERRCQDEGQTGDVCSVRADCERGLRCNDGFAPPQCQNEVEEGEPCTTNEDCEEPLKCAGGRCTSPLDACEYPP